MKKQTWKAPALKELNVQMTMSGDDMKYYESSSNASVTVYSYGGKTDKTPSEEASLS